MFSIAKNRMESVRDVVVSGENDELLFAAIYSTGKRLFVKNAARAFARSQAARGDMASASEIVRIYNHKKAKAWCTEATVALARKVGGDIDAVQVHCEGEDKVVIKSSIVSGDVYSSVSGLIDLLQRKEIADALAHSRIIGLTSPEIVFNAVLNTNINNRTKAYIELLWTIYQIVGADKEARNAILDSVIAFGSGDIKVKPPSIREAEERMRMIALYSAPKQKQSITRRSRKETGNTAADYKTLDIEGFGHEHEAPVEVVKC